MRAAYSVTAKVADVVGQCGKSVFEPGLANLFKAVSVAGSAAHPVHILRDHRMVGIWQLKPVQIHDSLITRGRSNSEPDKGSRASSLRHGWQVSDENIRPGNTASVGVSRLCPSAVSSRQRCHDRRFDLAVDHLLNLDGIHGRRNRNLSNRRIGARGTPKLL